MHICTDNSDRTMSTLIYSKSYFSGTHSFDSLSRGSKSHYQNKCILLWCMALRQLDYKNGQRRICKHNYIYLHSINILLCISGILHSIIVSDIMSVLSIVMIKVFQSRMWLFKIWIDTADDIALQHHTATSHCNVTLQHRTAASHCNITLQHRTATSHCNIAL